MVEVNKSLAHDVRLPVRGDDGDSGSDSDPSFVFDTLPDIKSEVLACVSQHLRVCRDSQLFPASCILVVATSRAHLLVVFVLRDCVQVAVWLSLR